MGAKDIIVIDDDFKAAIAALPRVANTSGFEFREHVLGSNIAVYVRPVARHGEYFPQFITDELELVVSHPRDGGDGNNAIYLAKQGFKVTGVDVSAKAISISKQKAREAKVDVTFITLNALNIKNLGKKFDTIIDFGLFHNLKSDCERYVQALSDVCVSKGQFLMMCFSDQAGKYSVYPHFYPKPMSKDEIRALFSKKWKIVWIRLGVVKAAQKYGNYSSWLTNMTSIK